MAAQPPSSTEGCVCSPARIHKLKILSILFLNIFYLRTLCFFLVLGVLGIGPFKSGYYYENFS